MAKSNYDGYVGVSKKGGVVIGKTSKDDRARGMKEAYDKDYEGMKTSYKTYRRDSDPGPEHISKLIGKADEDAAAKIQRANSEGDSEKRRELNRAAAAGEKRVDTKHNKY